MNQLLDLAVVTSDFGKALVAAPSAADARTVLGVSSGGGSGGAVDSVNGQTGVVVLDASDVGAAAAGSPISMFTNDAGYLKAADIPGSPVVSVNGQTGIVVLDAADVGAATAAQGAKADTAVQPGDITAPPVTSVAGKTGDVAIVYTDVGNRPTYSEGVLSARPATAAADSMYYASDVREYYRYSGAAWALVSAGGVLLASLAKDTSSPIAAVNLGTPAPIEGVSLTYTAGARPVIIGYGCSFRAGTAGATALVVLEVNGTKVAQTFHTLPSLSHGSYYRRSKPLTFPAGTAVTVRLLGATGGDAPGEAFGNPGDPITIDVVSV